MLHKVLLFLILLFCSKNTFNQNRILFNQIGTQDGLSNGSVKSIYQDREGFIWIGTIGGLNKFDGVDFKVYNSSRNNPESISADDITCIYEDIKGQLWIGTFGGGLNIYNKQTDRFKEIAFKSASDSNVYSEEIHTIFEDTKGNIWVGSENGFGKFIDSTQSFVIYRHQPGNPYSLSMNPVRSICEDTKGSLWIGTYGGGLNKFEQENGKFHHLKFNLKSKNTLSTDFINDIEVFNDSILLIATQGGGLMSFNSNSEEFSDFFSLYSPEYANVQIVRDILVLEDGTIWVGTDGEGLFRYSPQKEKTGTFYRVSRYMYSPRQKSSLGSNAIYKIMVDNQQNIWLGTAWNGISIIERAKSNVDFLYSDVKGYEPSPVLSVFVDNKKNLWIGSDGKGLYSYNEEKDIIRHYSGERKVALKGSYIQHISQNKNGNLWIGTFTKGLTLFNPESGAFRTFKNNPQDSRSLSHNNVRFVMEEKDGNCWVATWGGGLCYFELSTGTFTHYLHDENNPSSLSNNNVIAMEWAPNEKIWVGTFGGGLNLFDIQSKSFLSFQNTENNSKSISGNNILCLHADKNENLWIGTWGAGLSKLNILTQEFERFDLSDGLVDNTVTAIEEDGNGNLWLSTKKGVCSLNPNTNEIKPLYQGRYSRVNEFHINSSFKNKDGRIYFGGLKGIISFNPEEIVQKRKFPDVRLTGFSLFNKEVSIGESSPLKKQIGFVDTIILNHKQSVFSIRFAALSYPFSDDFEYAVKMVGFEQDWRNIGNQNFVTYTNLSPGKYTFQVMSKPYNSDWDNRITSVVIVVKPPFLKTWWAFGIYTALFFSLLYALQKYTLVWAKLKSNLKLERLQREQDSNIHQLKLRFFTNISHEIRTPLTLILDPLNKLIESGSGGFDVQKRLVVIKKNTDRLLHLINELLDFRKIEMGKIRIKVSEGNIVKFVNEIYLSFREYSRSRKINYQFISSDNSIKLWYDKQQLEKVIYNLLSNAFKFTPDNGEIKVEIIQENDLIKLIISDSGKGIPEEHLKHIFERFYQTDQASLINESGFGIGLSIAKELIDFHSGTINVVSKVGGGSIFTIALKKGNSHFSEKNIVSGNTGSDYMENYMSQLPIDVKEIQEQLSDVKSEFSDCRILIVEDNPDLRNYLQENLSVYYSVSSAQDGKAGVEIAVKEIPDLIVSDIMMPVMDGLQLCHILKNDVRTSHIPILLLTARTAMIYRVEGYESGADDYLSKPFSDSELKVRINNLLKNRKLLRDRFMKEALLQPKEIVLTSPDELFLGKLIEIIETNMEESEFKVEILSREMGMSHSVIYKKIKALTGQSLIEFVRDMRLKRAAQFLKQNKLSITEICYKVGFTDRRYFSQAFKKKFGVTPSDFAK